MAAALLFRPDLAAPSGPRRTESARSRRIGQLLTASALALGVTLALFIGMERMIRVKEVTLTPSTSTPLRDILPNKDVPTPPHSRTPVAPPEAISPPPARRQPQINYELTGVPTPRIDPVAPAAPANLSDFAVLPKAYSGPTKAVAIRAPRVAYPRKAAMAGLTGSCDVTFSVTAAGQPFDVVALCTNDAFTRAAERAVEHAQFSPAKSDDGTPRETHGLIYPIDFQMAQ